MAGIFISYRRDDAQGEALHLFDNLKQHFGGDRVFMDVIAIRPGEDYRKVIDSAVASCDVLITLIGKEWLQSTAGAGQPRLNDARDFVRLETAAALKRDVRLIPVLVQGAAMPTEEVLPDELKPLAFRNAIELSHSRWDYDVRMLIEALERVVTPVATGSATASAGAADRSTPSTTPLPSRERRPAWHLAVIGAVVACVLGGGGYWFWPRPATPPISLSGPKTTPRQPVDSGGTKLSISVPELVGLKEADAAVALERAGLALVKRAAIKRGDVEPGTVVGQVPRPGESVEKGRSVAVDVAVADLRSVPDLIGRSTGAASQALQQEDLKWAWRREATDAAKADAVIRQQPVAGTQVKPGSIIDVTIAVPATVEVPKLIGILKSDAVSALERASLRYQVSERPAAERHGMVIGQNPAAGTRAKSGSVVDLQVAVPDLRIVVDVVGKSAKEADDLLQKAGLRPLVVREYTDRLKPGLVLRQEPAAGARISPGATVTVTIAEIPVVEVPKVTGLSRAQAAERLSLVGLGLTWETIPSRDHKPGIIVKQHIEPGAWARAGTVVRLTVAVSPDAAAPDRCITGFVWREAFPGDRVCVHPKTRDQAASHNKEANLRLEQDKSKHSYGPDTCAQGYVWREASPSDHVCVKPEIRAQAAEDNKQAAARIAR